MSEENVEVVRRWFEEVFSRDLKDVQARVAEFWEPDGDYYPVRGFPEARPCHGHEEIAAFLSEYLAAWETYAYTVADAIAVGDDRVLIHGDIHAAGRTSGLVLEGHTHHCFWLRHGRFIRQEDHLSAKGALYALGLGGDSLEAAGVSD
jgi:ketosteroid isomerase-like protein